MSTHNLCFESKVRKIEKKSIPVQTPVFFLCKMGFKGVCISRICFPDVLFTIWNSLKLSIILHVSNQRKGQFSLLIIKTLIQFIHRYTANS